jgi:hypothetical protein
VPPCRYQAGFATLAKLVGPQIADCLENEHGSPDGNVVQRTQSGLLVWRQADNWTAFTDGYRTWINGPQGLAVRLNTERFAWEPDAGAPGTTLVVPPPPPPAPAPWAASPPPPVPTEPLVPGTGLGLPVSGPSLQMTPLAATRVPNPYGSGRLVKVTVKVEGGSNGQHVGKYDYWDFRLRTPAGVEYRPSALTPSTPGGLGNGTLAAGQFVVGDVYFEAPDDGTGYGLHYYPQGYSTPQVAISSWIGAVTS